jgi:hypothetical protein
LKPLLAISASVFGPDIELAQVSNDFWLGHGEIFNLPVMDSAGNLRIQQTKFYVANSELRSDHVKDREGGCHPYG